MTLQLPDPCPIDGTLLLPADVVTGELADTAIAGGRGGQGVKVPQQPCSLFALFAFACLRWGLAVGFAIALGEIGRRREAYLIGYLAYRLIGLD